MSLIVNDLFFFDDNIYSKLLRKESISIPDAIDFFNTRMINGDECEYFLNFFDKEVTPVIIRSNMNFFNVIFNTEYRFHLHGLLNEKFIYQISCEKIKLIFDFEYVRPKLSSINKVLTNPVKFRLMFIKWWTDNESIKEIQIKLKLFFIENTNNPMYIELIQFVRKYRYDTIVTKKLFFEEMIEDKLKRDRLSKNNDIEKSPRNEEIKRPLKKYNTFDTLINEFENLKL